MVVAVDIPAGVHGFKQVGFAVTRGVFDPRNFRPLGDVQPAVAIVETEYFVQAMRVAFERDLGGIFRVGVFDEINLAAPRRDGNLFIRGRSKSVIVLSHGENIYPESIEEKINSSINVIESLIVERNNSLEAMVHLDYEQVDQETKKCSEQQKLEYINSLLKNLQKDINRQLPAYSQIFRINERQEPFTKTATHKIKRYLYT